MGPMPAANVVLDQRRPNLRMRREFAVNTAGGPALSALVKQVAVDKSIVALIAFGSLARSEVTATSDVDLLVVLRIDGDLDRVRSSLRAAAADTQLVETLTPMLFTGPALLDEARSRPSFAAHLLHEGVVVYELADFDVLEKAIVTVASAMGDSLEAELDERLSVLDDLDDLDRFNGEFVPALSQIYTLSRSVVIARLLQEGQPEYSWRRMFDSLSRLYPEIEGDLKRLRDLRPYYEHVHGRNRLADRDQRVDAGEVSAAIDAVLAVSGRDPGA